MNTSRPTKKSTKKRVYGKSGSEEAAREPDIPEKAKSDCDKLFEVRCLKPDFTIFYVLLH